MLVEDVRNGMRVRLFNWTWVVRPRPSTTNCPDLSCWVGDDVRTDHVSWEIRSPVGTARQVYAPFGTEIEVIE